MNINIKSLVYYYKCIFYVLSYPREQSIKSLLLKLLILLYTIVLKNKYIIPYYIFTTYYFSIN